MVLPVFLDEAIHLEWAFAAARTGRVLGITDGSRYLPIWLYSLVLPSSDDPLRTARLLSVVFGLAAALGLAALGTRLYSPPVGRLAAVLYVAVPFTLLYDRMALVDVMLSALVVYALLFGVRWARSGRLSWALLLGLAVGAAGATKLYGLLALAVPPVCLLAFGAERQSTLRRQLLGVALVAVLFLLPALSDLDSIRRFVLENLWVFRTGPDASFSLLENVGLALLWPATYLTPVGFVLALLALAATLRHGSAADRVLAAIVLGWGGFFIVVGGRDWFPRYLLPAVPPLLLLVSAHGWRQWTRPAPGRTRRWIVGSVAAVWAASCLWFDRALLADPAKAPLPDADRWQYVDDWPSGYGLAEMAAFLRAESAWQGSIVVLRSSRSGPLLEGLSVLLRGRTGGIRLVEGDPEDGGLIALARTTASGTEPAYLIVDYDYRNEEPDPFEGQPGVAGDRVAVFPKPGGFRALEVYRIRPVVIGDRRGPEIGAAISR